VQFLEAPGLLLGLFIIILSITVAVGGVCIVRWRVHYTILKEDHEAAGFLYSMVGVVYAVLLGFITVVVWQQYRDTQNYVQQEAVRVSNLLRDARVFSGPVRIELRKRLVAYGRAVVDDEWNAMAKRQPSSLASKAYEAIWETVYEIQPETERERAFYRESITRLNELGGIRRSRLLSSESGMPSLLWVLLIGGAAISIAFTFMFGTKYIWSHVLTAGSLAGLIGFVLFLVLALSSPFSGTLSISPGPLARVLSIWEHSAER
jgi:hypothetical protein